MSPTDYAVSQKVIRGLIFVILSLKLAAKKKKKYQGKHLLMKFRAESTFQILINAEEDKHIIH